MAFLSATLCLAREILDSIVLVSTSAFGDAAITRIRVLFHEILTDFYNLKVHLNNFTA